MEKNFTIKSVNTNASKLLMVKIIKNYSELGLRDCKELLDSATINKPSQIKLNLTLEKEKSFLKELESVEGIEWTFNNCTYRRQIKLVQLGIIDNKQELVEILKREFNSTIFLDDILNVLTEDKLIELIKQIK